MKIYETGQKRPDTHSYTELSKTQFFPVSILLIQKSYELI